MDPSNQLERACFASKVVELGTLMGPTRFRLCLAASLLINVIRLPPFSAFIVISCRRRRMN